jgi:hypothetical protein
LLLALKEDNNSFKLGRIGYRKIGQYRHNFDLPQVFPSKNVKATLGFHFFAVLVKTGLNVSMAKFAFAYVWA